MSPVKIIGILLIILGALGLAYEKFTYTEDTHEAKLGPIVLEVKEKKTVDVPTWVGIGAVVVGVRLLVVPFKK